MTLTPAELWIHPSDNRLLPTNPVTSVLNQHYSQCLSNWVMFKHTKRGNRWLLQYVDTECLSCATASICVYTRGFFLYEQWMILRVNLGLSLKERSNTVQGQTWHSRFVPLNTEQQFPIPPMCFRANPSVFGSQNNSKLYPNRSHCAQETDTLEDTGHLRYIWTNIPRHNLPT